VLGYIRLSTSLSYQLALIGSVAMAMALAHGDMANTVCTIIYLNSR
jgi:hypothetical protein